MTKEVSAAVFGKGESFVLIPLDADTQAPVEYATARGYFYCGVMSYANGQASAKCEPDGIFTMMVAVVPFAELVAKKLKSEPGGGDWLKHLWTLEDPRD